MPIGECDIRGFVLVRAATQIGRQPSKHSRSFVVESSQGTELPSLVTPIHSSPTFTCSFTMAATEGWDYIIAGGGLAGCVGC